MAVQTLNATLKDGHHSVGDLTLYPGEAKNRGCREGFAIEVFAPAGEGWEFHVDDQPIPLSNDGIWRWSPGFFAGLVNAKLTKLNEHIASYILEVSPDPNKLAMPLYQKMLDELLDIDPALIVGTEPATERLGTLGSQRDAWLEFRRLRMHAPALIVALRQLAQRPIRTVRSSRRIAPLRAARRIDVRTVRTAAAMGTLGPLVQDVGSEWLNAVQEEPNYDLPWFEEHLDGPANRCITAMLLAVRRRAVQLLETLSRQISEEQYSETRTELAVRWPARRDFLEGMVRQLMVLLRTEPFCAVTNPEISAAGLNAIAAHPVYAQAYRCGWHAIRPGLQTSKALEAVWLCPSWELYERWCFGRIVQILMTFTDQTSSVQWDASDGIWKGRTASGVKVRAYSQLTFTSIQTAEFHSISRQRIPDIVITAERDGQQRYIILDAKYSQARSSILNAMAAAHIYNDSLRWNNRRPFKALLLAPAGGGAPWLEEEAFIEREGVGVLAISPENGTERLTLHLQQLLDFAGCTLT